ncbi:MAG: hypothetical protein D3911_09290, partial [Candidatus Electrothrix sp. AW3_4]|nr:hypothetical protein [Candidatus Electrothrix gigas]
TGKITFTDNGTFKDDPAPINYTGKDAEGNISDKATVTLSADPLPVASNDSSTHTPGTPTEIDVLKNDITGDTIVPATVSIVGGTDTDGDGYNDKLTVSGQGVWTVDKSTGKITFTDNGTFKDDPAPINYTGKDAEGNISDKATVTLSADPTLRLYKTASLNMTVVAPKDTVDVNDQIIYTFKVENKSNMTVTNVKVSDLLLSGLNCDAITSLASGAIQEFTCTGNVYTLIQEDIDAKSRINTADVSSEEVCTGTNDCIDTAIVLTAIEESPSISLLKNVELTTDNEPTGASEGDILSYTFTVGNTGNVTLKNVTLSDSLLSTLNCETIASLAPGAVQVLTCTGNTYTITAKDVTTGKIENSATVTGTPLTGPNVSNSATVTVQINSVPTYTTVSTFNAYVDARNKVVLEWTTASEIGTIGFYLERLNEQSGTYQAVNNALLPGMLSPPHGGTYRYVDDTAIVGMRYTYRVVEVAVNNQGTTSVPYTVQASKPLPMRNQMFADGPAGYTLQHQDFSRTQLKRFVARSESALEFAHQQKNKTGNTLKIPVNKDGLVYLSATELAAVSGLSVKQVGKYLKAKKCLITLEGEAVAVITANTGSALWFYGQAPRRNDIGQNIYLLELGKKGVKIASKGGRAKQAVDTPQSFLVHKKIEENHQPIHLYINTPVKDFWSWEYLMAYGSEYAITHTVAAPHLTGGGVATVTVNLVGVSNENTGQKAPFKVAVSLNGTEIGTAEWTEKGDYQFQTEVSAGLLEESGNEVQLVSQLNSGVTYSLIYLDSIELDYERSYEAVDGELLFSTTHYESVTVKGLSSAKVLALDVTEPNNPQRIRTLPGKNEAGEYSITILTKPDHNYYITENIRQTVSGEITVDSPSQLRSSDNQADYLVISPLNMMESAQRLADYRASQGMTTLVVDIEDVQDEFSQSLAAPEAVRNFLTYISTSWTQMPNYVVLIGDGSYDYKNYLEYGYPQVPTELVATPDGFFPSDNALADVSGNDGIPEFALGRIPVVDSIELNQYIDKLIAYEQTISAGANAVMALVSDNLDPAAGDFQASADRVHTLAAEKMTVHRFDAEVLGQSETHDRLIDALQQGASILHYVGHSSLVALGKKNNLLSNDDLNTISDIGRPLLMTSMACSTASFGYPPMNSIGESAVLRADGGAVSFFGATGLSQNHLADIMAEGLYRNLFDPATFRVGDAIVQGKQYAFEQGTERSFLDIYNLLGDPAMLTPVQDKEQMQ